MVNLFITGKFLPNCRYIPLLFPYLGELKNEKRLFADTGNRFLTEKTFNLVTDVKDADFILLPHEFFDVEKNKTYLDEHLELSKETGKRLLIFDTSDYTDRNIDVPNSIIFRVASYRKTKPENVVIMPSFVEDLSKYSTFSIRHKPAKPSIGFCGWAKIRKVSKKIKFWSKIFLLDIKKIFTHDSLLETHKQGLYFRMKAIKFLNKDKDIDKNFILRGSYTLHQNSIELSPLDARREFIDNIVNSDFTLCVRGDANISYRFYETLSLGRIPLFVDTDCVLPLEDVVDYDRFVLFVDYKNLTNIAYTFKESYNNISDKQFVNMQILAKQTFDKYLNVNSFFKYMFPVLVEKYRNS